jgi:hypothetical protein
LPYSAQTVFSLACKTIKCAGAPHIPPSSNAHHCVNPHVLTNLLLLRLLTNSTNRKASSSRLNTLRKSFYHLPPPARTLRPLLTMSSVLSRAQGTYPVAMGSICQCSGSDHWTALVPPRTDVEPTTSWDPLELPRQFTRSCHGSSSLALATPHTGFPVLLLSFDHFWSHLHAHSGTLSYITHHAPQDQQRRCNRTRLQLQEVPLQRQARPRTG